MATESQDEFVSESVSRVKGTVFEYLSLGASFVGIVMLAVLLVYVSLDAFDLPNASPEWLLTYFVTLVLPIVGFFVYSADDERVTRRVVIALVGGLVLTFVVFRGFETFVRPIPRLNWQLAYMFAVAFPVAGYAVVSGSSGRVGKVGFGFLGRLVGGSALGVASILLFVVLDYRLWLLAYTLGVLPAVGVVLYSRRNPKSPVSLLVVPTAIVGFVVASLLQDAVPTDVSRFAVYVWTLVVPASAGVSLLLSDTTDRRRFVATAVGTLALVAGVAVALGSTTGIQTPNAVLFVLAVGFPTVAYLRKVLDEKKGRVGLVLPFVVAGGIVVGTLVVETMGFGAPDPWLDYSFLTQVHSQLPERAGFYPAIIGSVFIVAMVAVFSFVLGVGTAVFLEDYAPDEGKLGALARVIQVNVANLAAVPSIVYGLLGLGVFVNLLGFGLGTGVTAALTLSLLILPITIISAREAVRSVPDSMRQASYAMGATRWQTTKNVVLPQALPGIFTGIILALGRAIGETAPLIMIGAPHIVFSAPESVWDKMSAMPMQIFVWSSSAQTEFRYGVLAAGVVALLIILLGMNATAIILRNRSERGD